MLDPAILKDNLEVLESNISRRNLKIDVNHLISLNEERKSLRFDAEQKRSQQKELGKKIANADKNEKEELVFRKYKKEGAGILSSLVFADGLVELSEEATRIRKGDTVKYFPFSEFGIWNFFILPGSGKT